MNTNLSYIPASQTWVKQSMPRIYRCARGSAGTFSCNAFHHLFELPIASNDVLIGSRVMIKFHVSIHDCTWADSRNWYVDLTGNVVGVPGNTTVAGTRLNLGEFTPNANFPNGTGRRANITGALCAQITGPGTIFVRFNCDSQGNTWTFRDDNLEQTNCVLFPLGG